MAVIALLLTACYPWPDTPVGNFIGDANAEVGWVNPPYSAGGFWCFKFVNAIGEATIPGWRDANSPGGYLYLLQRDPAAVPQVGDVVVYGDPRFEDQPIHVGIVVASSPGSIESIEGNSASGPDEVVVNNRPTHGPATEIDGYEAIAYLLP